MRSQPVEKGRTSAFERTLPPGLRQRLENVRLDLRALFRATDQILVGRHLPEELQQLFELDADFAEVLHLLDLARHDIDTKAMMRDTEASFRAASPARDDFLATVGASDRKRLEARASAIRATLALSDAYIDIPGRDPNAAM